MEVLLFILKLILLLAIIGFMFSSIIVEYISFTRDRKKGISHKRFRLFVFSVIYFIVITIVMMALKDLMLWLKSLSVIDWLASKIAMPGKVDYAIAVFSVILINFGIGALFNLLLKFVRIGMSKKKAKKKKENGEYTFLQKIGMKILKFFNNEKWFFVGKTLGFLSLSLTIIYAAIFAFYQVPVYWVANWIPYRYVIRMFSAGYIYPIITLLPLWEAYLFLAGLELVDKKCPDLKEEKTEDSVKPEEDLEKIDEECRRRFEDHFEHEVNVNVDEKPPLTEHTPITNIIAKAIERTASNPVSNAELYLKCLDVIVRNDTGIDDEQQGELQDDENKTKGILVNGSLFSGFSSYFIRYMSVILTRGDNVIFVCNDGEQIEQTYHLVLNSLEEMYSLYHVDPEASGVNFDHPVWKVRKAGGECTEIESAGINDCSVLVTDLKFLTSQRFEQRCENFINLTDTVVFVDTLNSVNHFSHQMSVFEATMKNVRETSAVCAKNSSGCKKGKKRNKSKSFEIRYMSHQIKYICFDNSRVPGLDKVLKNLLFVEFISANAMQYNSQAIVCCYNFEGRLGENGKRMQIQGAHTEEDMSVLVNMADSALQFGAGKVSLFAEELIPCEDLSESLAANIDNGLKVNMGVNFSMNDHSVNFGDDYNVVVAYDSDDNLPMITRQMLESTAFDKPILIMLFSRPYMFRDYYLDNIDAIWKREQLMRIPVEENGRRNAIQKILAKAGSGGISVEEIYNILKDADLEDYKELIWNNNISEVLIKIVLDCGKHHNEGLHWDNFFEFVAFKNFDIDGNYVSEERLCLRRRGAFLELLDDAVPAKVVIDGEEFPLTLPKSRITQNHIVGQNMLYNGGVYVINNIDTAEGKIFVKHATEGKNAVPYQYIQHREYHIDFSKENSERVYSTKHVELNKQGGFFVKDAKISVARHPMEVITKGYTAIDQRTLATNGAGNDGYINISGEEQIDKFKQTYRKYGKVESPVCSSDMIMTSENANKAFLNGALVMSIKLTGDFGEDSSRIAVLGAVMLNETIRAMFPSVADSVAVCPVLSSEFNDDESGKVLKNFPKVFCKEHDSDPQGIEFLIIEDCTGNLGVISVLMSSGNSVLKMLFSPIYEYLDWYLKADKKSDYLYFGQEKEPECFDFEGLAKLAEIFGKDEFEMKFDNVETPDRYDVCDFCGNRYAKGEDVSTLEDGRKMCKACASSLVDNNKKTFKALLENAKIFLESTYGITLDDDYEFCFESTVKIANTLKQNRELAKRGSDIPLKSYVDNKKKVHVECSVPSVNLSELLVRELTHVWQLNHIPELPEDLAEGHIALVAIQYLRFLNQSSLASSRTTYYESTDNVSGVGYRKIVRELLANPQYNNNPFRYLLDASGVGTEGVLIPPTRHIVESGDFGLPYVPETADRVFDGNINYFYRSRLPSRHQNVYDVLLNTICEHKDSVVVNDCTFDEVRQIMEAVEYDHPEIFWYRTFSMKGSEVILGYGATSEEVEVLKRRIDEVVPKYLEGIDDSMSAYDVAIRIHVKIISSADYDTQALVEQKREGGPALDKIDYLRSICGVFLNGKAVCEGYARAVQYLLQKCGIECAEAAGYIHKENGERDGAHAWNIIKIDGDYYYLDTTWDDSSNTVQAVKNTDLGFDYFFVTTDEITRTRYIDMNPTDLPVCDATRANYHCHNNCIIDSYDLEKIKDIAQRAAKNKAKVFSFKCTSKNVYERALANLCASGADCYDVLKVAAKANKSINASSYSYNYDKNMWTITVKFKFK